MRKAAFVLFAILSSVSSAEAPNQFPKPMRPHPFRAEGPWFEGWYTRVTDIENKISFAVITTSAIHDGETLSPGEPAPGYAALIVRDGALTFSREEFPNETSMTNEDQDFEWRSANARVSATAGDIKMGRASASFKILSRESWGAGGPEGGLAELPIPLHWYVYNMGGTADYEINYQDANGQAVTRRGRGFVHQEKNWGQVFPKSWMWLEASDSEASISMAGGDLDFTGVRAHSYMLGYRTGNLMVEFNLSQTLFTSFDDVIQPCSGTFALTAVKGSYKLVLKAKGSDFVKLSIPTSSGYARNRAEESFRADIEVELYRANGIPLLSDYSLVERRTFHDAALEFGADAMTCSRF